MDLDLGLLVVRLALGPMLIVHGWNKVFGGAGWTGRQAGSAPSASASLRCRRE